MKVHPRNAGTSAVDLAILVAMPAVIGVLYIVLYYYGLAFTQ